MCRGHRQESVARRACQARRAHTVHEELPLHKQPSQQAEKKKEQQQQQQQQKKKKQQQQQKKKKKKQQRKKKMKKKRKKKKKKRKIDIVARSCSMPATPHACKCQSTHARV
jgi:2-succinyl-5-enolpyruvyl-6-hydroxy-3-cyclohexene-1-carboxylate synthase